LKATLLSEGPPNWVLGMKSSDWESFNCIQSEFTSRPEVQASLDRLASKRRYFGTRSLLIAGCSSTDIGLISGGTHFLSVLLSLLPPEFPLLLLQCDRQSRKDSLPVALGLRWIRISHGRVGGVTNHHIWVGVRHLKDWQLAPRVSRSIGHIICHAERPRPCPREADFAHCTTQDTLQRALLRRPVVYPSHFSYTGFGKRALTGDELCSAFDIPNWMKPTPAVLEGWVASDMFSFMLPMQLFSAVLE
jgi:hypothetical protein